MQNKHTPICLFTFNRLDETIKTVEALKNNFSAPKHHLKIFSDGPRNSKESMKVQNVRNYIHTITGFRTIEIFESKENEGLATSVINGVSRVLESNESVIVLEDDLITSPNFLDFMQQALNFYKDDENILSISGFTMNLPSLPGSKDHYFGYRASSWGWGTWKKEWQGIDWEISDYNNFIKNNSAKRAFNRGGSDLVRMLRNQIKGKIDSWAIRFCYNQFQNNQKTVFPTISKVSNIGFGNDATHTAGATRFDTKLDDGTDRTFEFEKFNEVDEILATEFARKFSFKSILIDKIIQVLKK